jgi:hypothetical protein
MVTGLTNITRITAGLFFNLALRSDGTVWAWGRNAHRELGDGTTQQRLSPVRTQVPPNIIEIAAGALHALARGSDGRVWAWGNNHKGQLGNGTTAPSSPPGQVVTTVTFVRLAAGFDHSLGVRADGRLFGWGANDFGQFGDGTQTNALTPRKLTEFGRVTDVIGGPHITFAVRDDGKVVGSGRNLFGNLGDGTRIDRTSPVEVAGLTGPIEIATGPASNHTLAVVPVDPPGLEIAFEERMPIVLSPGDATSLTLRTTALNGSTQFYTLRADLKTRAQTDAISQLRVSISPTTVKAGDSATVTVQTLDGLPAGTYTLTVTAGTTLGSFPSTTVSTPLVIDVA